MLDACRGIAEQLLLQGGRLQLLLLGRLQGVGRLQRLREAVAAVGAAAAAQATVRGAVALARLCRTQFDLHALPACTSMHHHSAVLAPAALVH